METTQQPQEVKYPNLLAYQQYSQKYPIRPAFLDDLCKKAFEQGKDLSASQLAKAEEVLGQWSEERLKLVEKEFPVLAADFEVLQKVEMGAVHAKMLADMLTFFTKYSYLSEGQKRVVNKVKEHYQRQVEALQPQSVPAV